MTTAQHRALEELLPKYGVPDGPLDLAALFGRDARCTLEIGFGSGDALLELAQRHPDEDFLGVEVHRPGVGRLLLNLEAAGVHNVRLACEDAVEFLGKRVSAAALEEIGRAHV